MTPRIVTGGGAEPPSLQSRLFQSLLQPVHARGPSVKFCPPPPATDEIIAQSGFQLEGSDGFENRLRPIRINVDRRIYRPHS